MVTTCIVSHFVLIWLSQDLPLQPLKERVCHGSIGLTKAASKKPHKDIQIAQVEKIYIGR